MGAVAQFTAAVAALADAEGRVGREAAAEAAVERAEAMLADVVRRHPAPKGLAVAEATVKVATMRADAARKAALDAASVDRDSDQLRPSTAALFAESRRLESEKADARRHARRLRDEHRSSLWRELAPVRRELAAELRRLAEGQRKLNTAVAGLLSITSRSDVPPRMVPLPDPAAIRAAADALHREDC